MKKLTALKIVCLLFFCLLLLSCVSLDSQQHKHFDTKGYYRCSAYNRVSHYYYPGKKAVTAMEARASALLACHKDSQQINVCTLEDNYSCIFVGQKKSYALNS